MCFFWCFFFFKQKTAYEMRISDWSSDVCSSDLSGRIVTACAGQTLRQAPQPLQAAAEISGDGGPPSRGWKLIALSGQASPQAWQWIPRAGKQVSSTAVTWREAVPPRGSEERRLGEEGTSTVRAWGCPYHEKIKKALRH